MSLRKRKHVIHSITPIASDVGDGGFLVLSLKQRLQVKSSTGSSGWGWKENRELALIKSTSQADSKKKELVSCRNSRIESSCGEAILNKPSDK